MTTKKVKMAIEKAKVPMSNSCCDSPISDSKLHISISEADGETGFSIYLRGKEFLAEDVDGVLDIVEEMLS